MGDVVDYDYGNKRQWRRWLWNQVAKRTKPEKSAPVLFLAGEGALDIKFAERNGFAARNMIAVDHDADVVARLRRNRVLAIHGDLRDVLKVWPEDFQVAAVIADFCCGLERRMLIDIAPVVWFHKAFRQTTFAFNFLRGRDASSNKLRAPIKIETKHRGELFLGQIVAWRTLDPSTKELPEFLMQQICDKILRAMNPATMTYSSTAGSQKFDSLVLASPVDQLRLGSSDLALVASLMPKNAQSLRRQIAATRAHHTRRQPGWK
jgi:hypothetical protein